MVKNKYIAFGLFIIVFLAVWNLADYLYTTLITNGTYHFGAVVDGVIPVVVAIVVGFLLFLRKKSD